MASLVSWTLACLCHFISRLCDSGEHGPYDDRSLYPFQQWFGVNFLLSYLWRLLPAMYVFISPYYFCIREAFSFSRVARLWLINEMLVASLLLNILSPLLPCFMYQVPHSFTDYPGAGRWVAVCSPSIWNLSLGGLVGSPWGWWF